MAGFDLGSFFRHALHVRAPQLKGAPFIAKGQEAKAADAINQVTGPLAEAALVAFPAVAATALLIRPEQLHHINAISDPVAAAAVINTHIETILSHSQE